MGPRVLVDTNIIIDLFRNVPQAVLELSKYKDRAVSIITWMEAFAGLRSGEQRFVPLFEDNFRIIPLTQSVAEETVQIRQTTRLKLPDAIILATAHVEKRVLLTRNSCDFSPGRFVHIPYEI